MSIREELLSQADPFYIASTMSNSARAVCAQGLRLSEVSKRLFLYNIGLNGPKAVIYCFGLSSSRYVEYSTALAFLLGGGRSRRRILEVGCGHSILATYWMLDGLDPTVVDINVDALKWQIQKGKRYSISGISAVLADARNLPFRDRSFDGASCISSIEHIPCNGDTQASSEIGRILSDNGVCVISFSLDEEQKTGSTDDWAAGIPPVLRTFFGSFLPAMMSKVGVDRKHDYFERFYSSGDVNERIIRPSGCKEEDRVTLKSRFLMRFLHQNVVPTGVVTLLEYVLVRFFSLGKKLDRADAVILKLAKTAFDSSQF
jgi:ubiquinone/menaquinone biosynthesis C-methylase UbiE